MRIYFDACALNRLTDEQLQPRVRAEAEAVDLIIDLVVKGLMLWSASDVLLIEISRNRDESKRQIATSLLSFAKDIYAVSEAITRRAEALEVAGYGAYDAYHLAFAEQAKVDVLLTTDDRFVRQAARALGEPTVRVLNPVNWLNEVQQWLIPNQPTR